MKLVLRNNGYIFEAVDYAFLLPTFRSSLDYHRLYNIGTDGKITTEKEYVPPTPENPESPVYCGFSEQIVVTNLGNGQIRFELPQQSPQPNEFYLWYFSNGMQGANNSLIVDCKTLGGNGSVTLEAWVWDSSVPSGKRLRCRGTVQYFCSCGEKKEKPKREEWTNAGGSGKRIRIDAAIWVKDGEIGCRSRHFGKNFLGIWVPLNLIFNTTGIFANITGSFIREEASNNCVTIIQPFKEKQHPGGNNASWQNIIPQPGKNFVDPGKLSSGHRIRLKTGGTFFGFGVDRPRLVLD